MTPPKKISTTMLYAGMASLAMILFTIGTWRGGPEVFVGNIGFFRYPIPVIFAIVALLVERHRLGWLDFRSALKICFGIIVIAFAIQGLFTWILLHLIDPAFDRALRPVALADAEAWYRRLKMPEDQIRTNLDAIRDIDPFGLGAIVFGLAKTYVLFFLVAMLLAAIVRRKQPLEASYKQP